jgi:hypothetical protein
LLAAFNPRTGMACKRSKIVYSAFFLAERVEIADGLQKRAISQMRAFAGHSRGCGFWVWENGLGARCVGVDSEPEAGPVLLRLCAHGWRARVRGRAVVCCVVGLFTPPAFCAPERPASSGASQTRARAPKFVVDHLHCQPNCAACFGIKAKRNQGKATTGPTPSRALLGAFVIRARAFVKPFVFGAENRLPLRRKSVTSRVKE